MKCLGRILCLLALAVALSTGVCFADATLNLIDNYPEAGSHASPPTNLGIKLFFDGDVAASEVMKHNQGCFRLVGPDNKTVPLKAIYSESTLNYILVLANPDDPSVPLESNSEYRFVIDESLQSADGRILGEDQVIEFRTRDTNMDTTVNMILMGVMFVGMLVFSSLSMRKQLRKEAAVKEKEEKVNPYKVAKETGRSVEEVIQQMEKEKERAARKAAQKAAAAATTGAAAGGAATDDSRMKRVKGPRPIAAAGSTYITGRKAAAEKRAAEEAARRARGTTKPKSVKGKSKNTKKKK